MRILVVSDNPLTQSPYGAQALAISQALIEDGHDLLYFSYNYFGSQMKLGDVTLVGIANLVGGTTLDLLPYYVETFQPDIIFTLKDPFAFPPESVREWQVPWVAAAPIDSTPAAAINVTSLQAATHIVALTNDGQEKLAAAGLRSDVAHLGVDTDFYSPGETTIRKEMGIPDDVFVALMIASNQDPSDRKNFRQVLFAWYRFVANLASDAVLILHTDITPIRQGLDLSHLLDSLEFTERLESNIRAADPFEYAAGHKAEYVRDMMRAANVLLAVGNEGFGLTGIEAAACGTPSLCLDFAALRDTFCGGWQIPAIPQTGQKDWMGHLGAFWFRPSVEILTGGLKKASEEYTLPDLPDACRTAALRFSMPKVLKEEWLPLFKQIEGQIKEANLD